MPENHLCKSSPLRRNIPTTASPYYSTGGSYSAPTYSSRSSSKFGINFSKQGRNLLILILLGVPIGFITSLVSVNGIPLVYYLVQFNPLVATGWVLPLATSTIVVIAPPATYLGLEDVFFNAISVFFVDGLLRNTYTPKQYYLVFLITGIAGNIVSFFGYGANTIVISFGASGGIFGLVAGAVSADYTIRRRLNMGLLVWFIIIFVYSSLGGAVDIFAHLGGAAIGLVCGYVVGKSRSRNRFF